MWGSCTGQGVCGTGDTRPCDNCGTQTCSSSCAWGTCSIGTTDSYEENDSEGAAYDLAHFEDCADTAGTLQANINPAFDHDWYETHVSDNAGCDIEPWVQLSNVPAGQTYKLCVDAICDEGGDNDSQCSGNITGGGSVTLDLDVSGCDPDFWTDDDAATLIIHVIPISAGSCSSYTLTWGDQ